MVTFTKLVPGPDGKPRIESTREIPQSALCACPRFILVAEHYRADNSCRCDDPEHTEMKEWGYKWNKKIGRWA